MIDSSLGDVSTVVDSRLAVEDIASGNAGGNSSKDETVADFRDSGLEGRVGGVVEDECL